MKALKWTSISLAALFALVFIFYAEEDLRGWHAWHKCKADFEAKGFVLDWNKYIPPPVPDDQNFFAAPKMTDWFVKGHNGTELQNLLQNSNTTSVIKTEAAANGYLAWSDKLQPQFDLIRDALKRPFARMDGDYAVPYEAPIPNFISVRIVAQVLAQRAKCHLLLGQPDKALDDMTLLHDFCRLLEGAPTGKPMTLVAAMINVAVTGLYVDTIADGFKSRAWQEPQFAALQEQLKEINLTPFVLQSLQMEPVALCRDIQILTPNKVFDWNGAKHSVLWNLWPRGWTYQNMVNVVVLELNPLSGIDLAHDTISPRVFDQNARNLNKFLKLRSPYKILAAIVVPNLVKAEQTTAYNQTKVNEAQIACALERYRLANGVYPDSLDALAPHFIEKIPHDLIGGEPLIYHPTADGKFLLYSVGWNGTDDGGRETSAKTQNGNIDYAKGDWVWKNQPQPNTDSHR